MEHRRFVYLGLGGVIVLVAALAISSLNQNLTYYLYPSEALQQRADFPDGERFRLAGTVAAGTVVEEAARTTFQVTDGAATIEVVLTGEAPSLFAEGIPVLLEGAWSGDVFWADTALVRHSETYEVPTTGGGFPSG